LTVRELVALGRYPGMAIGRFTAHDGAQVDEALRAMNLSVFADRFVDSLGWRTATLLDCHVVGTECPSPAADELICARYRASDSCFGLIRQIARDLNIAVILSFTTNLACRFAIASQHLKQGQPLTRARQGVAEARTVERYF
jgi:ABC-type cobalamin/Fe3+-siderophores transport system ATPase subunit